MKKTLKIIGIVLAVLLCIAILILRIVMPNEMSALFDQIWTWLNQPLPIVGVSSIVLGFTIWKIFISTSFGKKRVAELEKEFDKLKADYEAKSKEAEDNKAEALAYKEEAVNMLASFKEELDTFAEQLAVACETSPNAKIREYAKTIRAKKEEIDTLYAEKKNELAKSVDERIAEQNRLEKCEQEIMGLRGILEEMKGLGVQNESEE